MEELEFSESEDEIDDISDLYGADPVFNTKEELSKFMASCNIEKSKKYENQHKSDTICYEDQKRIKKKCTCGKCENIWSDSFEHICCHQIPR